MKIFCEECGLYMGVIRDATLRKGIFYICENCNIKRIASGPKKSENYDEYYDYIMNILKGGK